ncbi:RsmB/NOP family class I SAM-dependent RNA methyltransferase [Caulobacter endophyticus]|uniref:RsmB/NOP family class I SAM-dependent RNA methyltransferase n=1 Tax=Caulobacter endophyticus TaxID=2172652 RepID=UPI0024106BE0|nr:RsmB/NOP family class I SAM-dependent RNA methyltransferase [Caulobacter endophyticus]MDG2528742.1 RsmB/NOP family class I SAM-dependent RNA methyltransferase [Caulobacter endophyticus]
MTQELNDGLPAREAALALLDAALSRRGGLDEAATTNAFRALEPRERAFARALAMAALRRLGPVDRALAAKLSKEPPPRVRNLLRLGATQAFFLDVPAFAAVATSVELAGANKASRPFKGLVNAVLRGLLRDGAPADDPSALVPPWLFARWTGAWGQDDARALAAVVAEEPATDLSLKPGTDVAALAEALEAEVLPGDTLRTRRRGDVAGWPEFEAGSWWVQDAAAAIPARLLDVKPGETAVDLCAAPGGKTLQLAAAGAEVVAVDRSAARLKRVSENLARMGLKAEVVAADGSTWADERTFDAVLLDAPCSATGTFRRHPDVLWAARPGDVASLAAVQSALLDSAAKRTAPGGRLVYCVCSLEPEEGEAQVEAFLTRHPEFSLAPITAGEGGAPPASLTARGTLRLLPHHREGGQDGFFAARFVKAA